MALCHRLLKTSKLATEYARARHWNPADIKHLLAITRSHQWRTYLVGKLDVTVGKMRRTPAGNGRIAEVLFSGDAESDNSQNEHGEAAVQTVTERITSALARVTQVGDKSNHSLHRSRKILCARRFVNDIVKSRCIQTLLCWSDLYRSPKGYKYCFFTT